MVDHAPLNSLLTVKEAAARLAQLRGVPVSTQAVYRMTVAKAHRLPTVRIGRSVFVADLDAWLGAQAAASVAVAECSPTATPPARAVRVRRRASKSLMATKRKRNRFGTPAGRK